MEIRRYAAAGGVVIDDGRVLLLDRPTHNEVRLPKGHIDPGEHPQETALRETREEAGYDDLAIVADLGSQVVEFDYKGYHVVRDEHYFLMRLRSHRRAPRTPADEVQFRVQWTPLAEAVHRLTYEAEQEWVRRAIAVYRSPGKFCPSVPAET